MTTKRLKCPRDPNQLAKLIVAGQVEDKRDPRPGDSAKDPAAVSLGRRGGLKGGISPRAALASSPPPSPSAQGGGEAVATTAIAGVDFLR
jgi:hypothetical protein